MSSLNFGKIAKGIGLLLAVIFLPMPCLGYVIGDINSNDEIGLEETIYSLQVVSGFVVPVSGTIINVPADVPTIQQAIDAAAEGDTISVAGGTYEEALTITGKSLTITGAGIGDTFIDGNTGIGIEIDHSPGVLIENLTVNECEDGINASNHSSVEVRNTTIQGCTDRGIQIDDFSIGVIADSTIANNGGDGIGILTNSLATLTGTVTTQNNLKHGLLVYLGSSVLLDGLTYNSNSDNGGLLALGNSNIFSYSDSTLTITDSGASGISLSRASLLYSSSAITVSGSLSNGLEAGDNSTVLLKGGSLLIENCSGGFLLIRSSTADVTSRLELSNCDGGIEVIRGSVFHINDSANIIVDTITSNEAIAIAENSTFRASGGTILVENNSSVGISVGRSSTLQMKNYGTGLNAIIRNNSSDGISINASNVGIDDGVSVTNNSGNGISIVYSICYIDSIDIQSNSNWGISVDDGSSLHLSNSTIQNNNGANNDISLGFGSQSSLYSNTIDGVLDCDATVLSRGNTVCP